jgi:hypothetical protein
MIEGHQHHQAGLNWTCREDLPARLVERLPGIAIPLASGYGSEQLVVPGEPYYSLGPKRAEPLLVGRVDHMEDGGLDSFVLHQRKPKHHSLVAKGRTCRPGTARIAARSARPLVASAATRAACCGGRTAPMRPRRGD